jgi:hypothetical protein
MPDQNEVDTEQSYGDSTGLTAVDAGVEPAIHGGDPTIGVDPEIAKQKQRDALQAQLDELNKDVVEKPLYDPITGKKLEDEPSNETLTTNGTEEYKRA